MNRLSTHTALKARFAFVRQDLDQVLVQLSADDLGWRPAPGLKSIREQLLEIADKEREVVAWLERGEWPEDDPSSFDAGTASLAEIRTVLGQLRLTTYTYIDACTEMELEILITPPEKWWEALRLEHCPLSEILQHCVPRVVPHGPTRYLFGHACSLLRRQLRAQSRTSTFFPQTFRVSCFLMLESLCFHL